VQKDFYNTIGTKRPIRDVRCCAAIEVKADLARTCKIDANDPQQTFFRKSFIVNAFAHIKGASITWNASSRVDHLFHPGHY
jgi:hypothetical protein